jgi:hypothetical protein
MNPAIAPMVDPTTNPERKVPALDRLMSRLPFAVVQARCHETSSNVPAFQGSIVLSLM